MAATHVEVQHPPVVPNLGFVGNRNHHCFNFLNSQAMFSPKRFIVVMPS